MKIILTREVGNLGLPGDVVEVKDGYGRNYLLPQGYAIPATRGAERQIAQIRRAQGARLERTLAHAKQTAESLSNTKVVLRAKAGAEGKLYGSVTAATFVEAVAASGGPALDRRQVELSAPVRSVGEHPVLVRLHPEVTVEVRLTVVAA